MQDANIGFALRIGHLRTEAVILQLIYILFTAEFRVHKSVTRHGVFQARRRNNVDG
jgi:hypothetical protein